MQLEVIINNSEVDVIAVFLISHIAICAFEVWDCEMANDDCISKDR
jgi:hypothetical protein